MTSMKSTKSSKSAKTRVSASDKDKNKSKGSGLGDIENADAWSFDDDPKTAPQECSVEQALSGAYLYPFEAVLKALDTDPDGGLSDKDVKARQVSRACGGCGVSFVY